MFYIYLNVVIFLPNAYQTANTLANGDKCISFGAVFCPKMCKCRLLHMAPHSGKPVTLQCAGNSTTEHFFESQISDSF